VVADQFVDLADAGQLEIAQGQQVGALSVTAPDYPGLPVPVYAVKSVPRAGIFGRMIIGLRTLIKGRNAQ